VVPYWEVKIGHEGFNVLERNKGKKRCIGGDFTVGGGRFAAGGEEGGDRTEALLLERFEGNPRGKLQRTGSYSKVGGQH